MSEYVFKVERRQYLTVRVTADNYGEADAKLGEYMFDLQPVDGVEAELEADDWDEIPEEADDEGEDCDIP